MEKKKNYLLAAGIIVCILVIGVGMSFAYFVGRINSEGTGASADVQTATIGDTTVTMQGKVSFSDTNIYPGHKNISTLKVIADGDREVLYNLVWTGTNSIAALNYTVYKTTTEETPSITCTKKQEGNLTTKYYETCTNNNFTNLGEAVATGEIPTSATEAEVKLLVNETLQATSARASVYYYIVLEFPNKDEEQEIDLNGTVSGTTKINLLEKEELNCKGAACEYITANKTIATRTNFTTTLETNTTGTMYQAEDEDGTSYYYAGAVDDNWFKFGQENGKDIYWRIIRINGDGSIRMIYAGTDPNVTTGTGTQISNDGGTTTTYAFNTTYSNNMHVGFMYTSGQVHGLGTSSNIKNQLDTWYNSNLNKEGIKEKIDINAGFCGDRTPLLESGNWPNYEYNEGGGTGKTDTYYGAYYRLYFQLSLKKIASASPTYKCNYKDSNGVQQDLYTTSSSNKGNKALTNPIGLITADEVAYAGGLMYTANTSYYLYTNQEYWMMSPHNFNVINYSNFANVFAIGDDNSLRYGNAGSLYGVRPTINLRPDVQLTGTGTATDPYTIVS